MSKIYFHPDISCQEIKDIENEYKSRDDNQLIDKASDYICKIITTKFSVKDKIIFVCGLALTDSMVFMQHTNY